jgi:hypothetical protein
VVRVALAAAWRDGRGRNLASHCFDTFQADQRFFSHPPESRNFAGQRIGRCSMLKVAYLANQFPSPVEWYVAEEIRELRRRGVCVIPCSARPVRRAAREHVRRHFHRETNLRRFGEVFLEHTTPAGSSLSYANPVLQ